MSAIRSNSEDDTPRLVFADWLDENEPDAKPRAVGKGKPASSPSSWAALIRTECELAQLEADGSAAQVIWKFFREKDSQAITGVRWEKVELGVARRIELSARAEQLRRTSARTRKAGLPQKVGVSWPNETHRGFPAEVLVSNGEKLFANMDRLIDSCPAVTLNFFGYPTKQIPVDAISRGLLKWCRALAVTSMQSELLPAMSGSPDAAGVRFFWFAGPGTADEAITPLGSPHWSGLRELSIQTYGGLSRESALRLFREAPHLRQLIRNRIDSFPPAAGSAKSDLAVDFCTVITHTGGEGTGTPDRPSCAPANPNPAPAKRQASGPGGGLSKPHEFQRLLAIKATWPLSKTHLTP
ncbi:MAG: TIGR02996 domain-containing protein, partial [Planctomycetia bacterium]|nr:TIGR02996 domain-containing protein [Planctomycetia bacterium]